MLQRPFTKNPALALYGLLIEDTRVLEGNFLELSYSHTKREGNEVAHCLARLALTLSDVTVWMEDVPLLVLPFVQTDFPYNLKFLFFQNLEE